MLFRSLKLVAAELKDNLSMPLTSLEVLPPKCFALCDHLKVSQLFIRL